MHNLGFEFPALVWQVALFVGITGGLLSTYFAISGSDTDQPGPREKLDRLNNLVRLRDALAYWHFREWNLHLDGVDAFVEYGNAATRFEACAGNDALQIWGRQGRNPNTFVKPIPAEVWTEQLIDRSSIYTEIASTVYRDTLPSYQHHNFFDLAVNWKEVEHLFEPKKFRRIRAWLRQRKRALTTS